MHVFIVEMILSVRRVLMGGISHRVALVFNVVGSAGIIARALPPIVPHVPSLTTFKMMLVFLATKLYPTAWYVALMKICLNYFATPAQLECF